MTATTCSSCDTLKLIEHEISSMRKDAKLSTCEKYRYSLTREWDNTKEKVAFVLLNPSTADASQDDPTVRRCIAFAKCWGYGSIEIVNLFAYRTPHPSKLKEAGYLIGEGNDQYIMRAAESADLVVLGWGNHGTGLTWCREVVQLLKDKKPKALSFTQQKQPYHPLWAPCVTKDNLIDYKLFL
jgi:hypothetical protein